MILFSLQNGDTEEIYDFTFQLQVRTVPSSPKKASLNRQFIFMSALIVRHKIPR